MRLQVALRRRPRLSLIPLIDVMLVLLFFFMLATTYVDYGRTSLELAPAERAGASGQEPDVARVQVLEGGQLRLEDTVLTPVEAIARLREAHDVRLAPAAGVPLQTLLGVWEQLKAAGIPAQLAEGAR